MSEESDYILDTFNRLLMNATPYIQRVAQETKWDIVRQTLGYAHQLEMGVVKTRELFRSHGFTFGDAAFSEVFKESIANPYQRGRVRFTKREAQLTEHSFDISVQPLKKNYLYKASYLIYDEPNNEFLPRTAVYYSDELKSRAEIEAEIKEHIANRSPTIADMIENVNIRYAYINPIRGME